MIRVPLALSAFGLSGIARAQGLVGDARRGSAEGDRVVGRVVGGAVGTVNGALGIDSGGRADRTDPRARRAVRHPRRRRRRGANARPMGTFPSLDR